MDQILEDMELTVLHRVTNAIAMASRRTGVDFAYLLGQAKIESSLNPSARATTSSATSLSDRSCRKENARNLASPSSADTANWAATMPDAR